MVFGVKADNGQVGLAIAVNILGSESRTAVLQGDFDLVGPGDHMVVGQDHTLGIDNEAGAKADLRHLLRHFELALLKFFKKSAKLFGNLIVDRGPAALRVLFRLGFSFGLDPAFNANHGRQGLFDDISVRSQFFRGGRHIAVLAVQHGTGNESTGQTADQETHQGD
jgi:hypothetical protein